MRPLGNNQSAKVHYKKRGRAIWNKMLIVSYFLFKGHEIARTVSYMQFLYTTFIPFLHYFYYFITEIDYIG